MKYKQNHDKYSEKIYQNLNFMLITFIIYKLNRNEI